MAFSYYLSIVLSIAFYLPDTTSAQCAPGPVVLPVKNVTVNGGQIARGIPIEVGSQQLVFEPIIGANNTYVYSSSLACNAKSSSACATQRGGSYSQTASNSFANRTDALAAGGDGSDGSKIVDMSWNQSAWMTESFAANSAFNFKQLPIGLPNTEGDGWRPEHPIGLGTNSTLLNSLKAGNYIGARVWSYFHGLVGPTSDNQMDGSLILGGFDAGKVTGAGANFTIRPDPPIGRDYPLGIEDIRVSFPNGTSVTLLPPSTLLPAMIDPSYPGVMSFPKDYYYAFQQITGTQCELRDFGLDYFGMLCDDKSANPLGFTGGLIVKIQNGPAIKITNDQLFGPTQTIGTDGNIVASQTTTTLRLNMNDGANLNDTIMLGRYFFSSAYIMANLDRNQFTIWSADPRGESRPAAVDSSGMRVEQTCTSSPASPSSPVGASPAPSAPTASSVNDATTQEAKGLSVGAVIGIVIGVFAAISIVAAATILLRIARRRKRQPIGVAKRIEVSEVSGDSTTKTKRLVEIGQSEMKSEDAELDSEARYELPGDWRPAELARKSSTTEHVRSE